MNGINLSLFGERLKDARKGLGLNQAEAADLVGVTREHWGRCERGLAMPGGEVFAALANAGADVPYILTGMPNTVTHAVQQIKDSGRLADYPALAQTVGDAMSIARSANTSVPALPTDEQMWLDCYREWSPEVKKRELRRVMGVSPSDADRPASQPPAMGNNNQVNSAPGAVQIKGAGNFVLPRHKK